MDFVVLFGGLGPLRGRRRISRSRVVVGRLSERILTGRRSFGREHDEVVSNDFGAVPLSAGLIFPRAGLKVSFDVNFLPLGNVFFGDFGKPAPNDDVMEFGLFLFGTGSILPYAGRRDAEGGDLLSVGGLAHFGISREIADKLDLVKGIHASKKLGKVSGVTAKENIRNLFPRKGNLLKKRGKRDFAETARPFSGDICEGAASMVQSL